MNVPNASSTKTKRDNWAFIQRALGKFEIDLPASTVEQVIAGDGDAVVKMVNTVYTFLTKRTPPSPPPRPAVMERSAVRGVRPVLPKIKKDAPPPDSAKVSQQSTRRMMRPSASGLRTATVQSERSLVGGDPGLAKSRGPLAKPVFEVGKTQVLKPRKGEGSMAAITSATHPTGGVRPVFDILNGSVKTVLEADDSPAVRDILRSFDPRRPVVACLAAGMEQIPDRLLAAVIGHMRSKALYIADSCVGSTREFWLFLSAFIRGYHALPSAPALDALRGLIQEVIAGIRDRDVAVAHLLLLHYALPLALPVITRHRRLLEPLLSDVVGLLDPTDVPTHLAVVRAVQEGLPAAATAPAIASLAAALLPCVPSEAPALTDVIDLYLYYATVGAGHTNGATRADSIRIAEACARADPESLEQHLDQLADIANDPWCGAAAAVLRLAVAVSTEVPESDVAETIAATVAARPVAAPISIAVVTTLVPRLPAVPALGRDVVRHLVGLDPDLVRYLLTHAGPAPPLPPALGPVATEPLMARTDPALLWGATCSYLDSIDADHLDAVHLAVLAACVDSATGTDQAGLDAFESGFEHVVDHLYVGLCDPLVHAQCRHVLSAVLLTVRPALVAQGRGAVSDSLETVSSVLKMLTEPGADPACLESTMDWLDGLLDEADADLRQALRLRTVGSLPHELMLQPRVKAFVEAVESRVASSRAASANPVSRAGTAFE